MAEKSFPAPESGMLLSYFLTVADVPRSRAFYSEVLGGEVILEENPCTVRLANSWLIMNPGGGPTPDKPGITLHPPEDPATATCFLNIRVADIQAVYQEWSAKGAEFVTPPIDRKAEIRCYLRDPDGYLIEIGQATGMLHGVYADPPAGKGPGTQ
ncbi:VOC family protein [Streptomyces albidoflavus]|uniref:VOC family protein n=1 Tax=Streptomyces albidoflavus TaxID=1886 RepID=UPI003D14AE48